MSCQKSSFVKQPQNSNPILNIANFNLINTCNDIMCVKVVD